MITMELNTFTLDICTNRKSHDLLVFSDTAIIQLNYLFLLLRLSYMNSLELIS